MVKPLSVAIFELLVYSLLFCGFGVCYMAVVLIIQACLLNLLNSHSTNLELRDFGYRV